MLDARSMAGPDARGVQIVSMSKKVSASFLLAIFCLALFAPFIASGDPASAETFTISGFVFDEAGNSADSTSIKVDSMSSVWSDDGAYSVEGITYGQHTIRAYFMNNGHNVIYRQIFVDSDVSLDWHSSKNWITYEVENTLNESITSSDNVEIEVIETMEAKTLEYSHSDFGPYDLGGYYTIKTSFDSDGNNDHYKRLKIESGSATEPAPNHFVISEGKNSLFGYVSDAQGLAMQGVSVSSGDAHSITNSDGFYMLENLQIGEVHNVTFDQGSMSVHPVISKALTSQQEWTNITAETEIMFPENATFTTRIQALPLSPFDVEWTSGNFTDYFHVYVNDFLIFNTTKNTVEYNPTESGTYEFRIEAMNANGSTSTENSLLIMVLPEQSESDLWGVGMEWNYSVDYYPSSITEQVTMTVIGKEPMMDAFDQERSSFLVRMSGPHYEDEERSYRWVDSETLLYLHSYWADDPDVSSYYQEGFLGWNFTDADGNQADLLSSDQDLNLHFNRTNIIGVPGHPNGYDDTFNQVEITRNVSVETPAGTFLTTYICITDTTDGVKSWELWYNDTVRNWVKKIDRLPGSHSDYLVMELSSYDVPITPQFMTEEADLNNKNYDIEWGDFQGADTYELFENGQLIYSGAETSFSIVNQPDGEYSYSLVAVLASGLRLDGDLITLSLHHIVVPPVLDSQQENLTQGDEVSLVWTAIEGASWYALTMENEQGELIVVYNGTDTAYSGTIDDEGRNRFRVSSGTYDGKFSEPSDSVFIFVEAKENTPSFADENLRKLLISVLILASILSILTLMDRRT